MIRCTKSECLQTSKFIAMSGKACIKLEENYQLHFPNLFSLQVGGPSEGVDAARPLLQAMGSRVVHCGGAGNGAVRAISIS